MTGDAIAADKTTGEQKSQECEICCEIFRGNGEECVNCGSRVCEGCFGRGDVCVNCIENPYWFRECDGGHVAHSSFVCQQCGTQVFYCDDDYNDDHCICLYATVPVVHQCGECKGIFCERCLPFRECEDCGEYFCEACEPIGGEQEDNFFRCHDCTQAEEDE